MAAKEVVAAVRAPVHGQRVDTSVRTEHRHTSRIMFHLHYLYRGKTTVHLPVDCFTNVGRIKLCYVKLNNSNDVT